MLGRRQLPAPPPYAWEAHPRSAGSEPDAPAAGVALGVLAQDVVVVGQGVVVPVEVQRAYRPFGGIWVNAALGRSAHC